MSCYSLDFRKQVLKMYHKTNRDIDYIKENFNICRRTLFNWLKREKNGELKPYKRREGKPYKLNVQKLEELNKDNKEEYTLKELSDLLNISKSAIHKYFVKNKITFKKKTYDTEKVIKS